MTGAVPTHTGRLRGPFHRLCFALSASFGGASRSLLDAPTATHARVVWLQVPCSKVLLGYPSSTKCAGSGYLDPETVCSIWTSLQQRQVRLAGMYTWDLGCDQQSGWQYATTVGKCLGL